MRWLYLPLVAMFTIVSAAHAQNDPHALRGVFGPGQSAADSVVGRGIVRPAVPVPAQPPAALTRRLDANIPSQPAVSVPGPAAAGQALPFSIIPTPVPGQPGYGSAMINGRRAIIEQGTNRIVRYVD